MLFQIKVADDKSQGPIIKQIAKKHKTRSFAECDSASSACFGSYTALDWLRAYFCSVPPADETASPVI